MISPGPFPFFGRDRVQKLACIRPGNGERA
jgi:hypothetical protein